MNRKNYKEFIEKGEAVLGIELGSTRIKSVLIDDSFSPIASGESEWENRFADGIWTYTIEDIWNGLQNSYLKIAEEVKDKYGVILKELKAIGFSAMMHGYLPFDEKDKLLVPFRTWRNSITQEASEKLTELFQYNIPQRWSIAHLYQAILNKEPHVREIRYITTLAGYVHWKLTGQKVIGIGDASGMFPVDPETKDYDSNMICLFDQLIRKENYDWPLKDILPEILTAGKNAGKLTEEGARLLDVSGNLQPGILLAPPEGDAQTGMMATNSVAVGTGNVSVGTSAFATIILEKKLRHAYPEIDVFTTPEGNLAANIHANNGTSDLNAWVGIFREFAECMKIETNTEELFKKLYTKALEGDYDCGELLSYGYLSGENLMNVQKGRPLFIRKPESKFTLANFIRANLFSVLAALRIGTDLLEKENVDIVSVTGHGGFFKTKEVGQKFLAAALKTPVSVMETAGEGGAWGMALLAAYMYESEGKSLQEYLKKVFSEAKVTIMDPEKEDESGFDQYLKRYIDGIAIEKKAAESLL